MTDIFISYSRKDQAFARRLFDSLAKEDLEAWVDWEGIPPTADWLAEVYSGIDAADTFAFIISPDSLASEICNLELEHALKHNKRLVPIVCRDPERMEMHKQLSAHNWIFVNDETFDVGVQTIVDAINLDLGYVRAHTRLLTRALEWERLDRDASYVLRGNDLVEAEGWLGKDTEDVSPRPTALQREYILASRQHASKQQRNILFGVVAALVVSVGLGFVAFSQWQLAGTERDRAVDESEQRATQEAIAVNEAEKRATQEALALEAQGVAEEALATQVVQAEIIVEQSRNAKAQVLAANSSKIATIDSQLSLLLALYGAQVTADEGVILPEVQEALYQALDSKLLYSMSGAHDSAYKGIEGLTITTDGLTAMTTSEKFLGVWDLKTGKLAMKIPIEVKGQHAFFDAAVNPIDASRVALAGHAGVTLFDLETEEAIDLLSFDFSSNYPVVVEYSPDGQYIAAGWDLGSYISIWDGNTGVFLRDMPVEGFGSVKDIAFSADSHLLAAGFGNGYVGVFRTDNGQLVHLLKGHTDSSGAFDRTHIGATGVAFNSDDTQLLTVGSDGLILMWDIELGSILYTVVVGENLNAAAFESSGDVFAVGQANGLVRVYDAESGSEIYSLSGHFNAVNEVAFNSVTGELLTTGEDGTVKVWQLDNSGLLYQLDADPAKTYEAFLSSSDSWNDHYSIEDVVWTREVAFSADGQYVWINVGDTYVYDLEDLSIQQIFNNVSANPKTNSGTSFVASGQGIYFKKYREGYVGYFDLAIGQTTNRIANPGGWTVDFSLSASGEFLLAAINMDAFADQELYVWSLPDGEEVFHRVIPSEDFAYGAALNPTGEVLAYSSGGALFVVDVGSGETIVSFEAHTARINDLEFSSDGAYLASASKDGTVKLWAVNGNYVLQHILQGHAGSVNTITFDPHNEFIVTGGQDGFIKLWDLERGVTMRTIADREFDVAMVAMSPDGSMLVSGGAGDMVNVYSVDTSGLIEQALAKLLRSDLTTAECKRYLGVESCQLEWLNE